MYLTRGQTFIIVLNVMVIIIEDVDLWNLQNSP